MSSILAFLTRNSTFFSNPWQARRDYVRPVRGALERDFYRVTGDMRAVGKDLRAVAKKELAAYGK